MSKYDKRRWELSVSGTTLIKATDGRQFKCVFEILHDFGGYTSYADISLYNLNVDTANKVLKKGESISFKAGYVDSIDNIFKGVIKNVLRERRGPSTITRLICISGKLNEDQPQINETIGKDAKVTDIIKALGTSTGFTLVMDDEQFSDVNPYPYGYTLSGDPRVYLDNLAKTHDFSYVVENDKLVVTRNNAFRKGDVHVISQFTGMEGIPEITEVGADVVTRLNPKIKIGGRFKIESKLATFNFSNLYYVDVPDSAGKGEYRIFRVSYSGDTHGDTWSNKITGYR